MSQHFPHSGPPHPSCYPTPHRAPPRPPLAAASAVTLLGAWISFSSSCATSDAVNGSEGSGV